MPPMVRPLRKMMESLLFTGWLSATQLEPAVYCNSVLVVAGAAGRVREFLPSRLALGIAGRHRLVRHPQTRAQNRGVEIDHSRSRSRKSATVAPGAGGPDSTGLRVYLILVTPFAILTEWAFTRSNNRSHGEWIDDFQRVNAQAMLHILAE